MNKQYVKAVQKKREKADLRLVDSKMFIAILAQLFNDNISLVQRTETKEGENVFFAGRLSCYIP